MAEVGLTTAELLSTCVEMVKTFAPSKTTVDAHVADFVAHLRNADDTDARFLGQVMYGVTRYKKLLKVFISSLYFKHAGETQRSDLTLYTILGYLVLLRLEEMGFTAFKQLALSQENIKMIVFLKFAFSQQNLTEWLRPEWIKLYDPSFIDTQIISKVLVFEQQVTSLQEMLTGRMEGEAAKKEAAAEAARALAEGRGGAGQHTTPEPFVLTQPKPRLMPLPEEVIENGFKAKPVPDSMYKSTSELKEQVELDQKKDANRMLTKQKYADPKVQPFNLRVASRRSNLQRIKDEVEAARQAECNFEGPKANPVPKHKAGAGNVRLNSAAILREDNLYRKKQEAEAQLLAAYEQELRDSSEFDAWQARMRAEDEEQRLAEVERRRIETLLADEEAKEARLRAVNEKRAIAGAMKLESDANAVKREQEAEAMRLHQKALVLDVQAQRERPAQAAEDMVRQNHLKAKELREEKEALEERAAAEAAAEAERRADLIRQIRALELVPKVRVKTVDPTYTPQHGLLEEMSLAELRERLNSVEVERQREEEARRTDIISAKKERDDDLRRRMERLSAMRELSAQQATSKRELAKRAHKEAEAQRQGRLAEAQIKVHAQMEAKRAARAREEARLAEELKQIKLKKAFLDADKEAVERSKFESLQGGARRELVARQETGMKNATNAAKIHDKETAQRLLNLQQEREIHEAFLRDYERRASEHQYDSNIAEDTLQASRQMLKARLGLGVKTGLPTSSSWMQNTRQPLQNTGRPFDDTLQQTAPRVRTAEY